MHRFPQVLKELREERKLTQAELASNLGYKSAVTIAQWETGKRTPGLDNLIVIAKFFGITIDCLVGLEN